MNATGNFSKRPVYPQELFTELTGRKLKDDTRSADDMRRDWESLKKEFARGRKTKTRTRGAA